MIREREGVERARVRCRIYSRAFNPFARSLGAPFFDDNLINDAVSDAMLGEAGVTTFSTLELG